MIELTLLNKFVTFYVNSRPQDTTLYFALPLIKKMDIEDLREVLIKLKHDKKTSLFSLVSKSSRPCHNIIALMD